MADIKEIERSIIKTYRKELWAKFVHAIDEYQLLKEHDRVCICISGGKDSMILAKLFQELHRHSEYEFEIKFLLMDPGYSQKHLDLIHENLKKLEIPATIVQSDIFEVANKQEKNPCYLCARMRRGFLYQKAQELGCNKIALGHHYDDVIETTLMNMLNSGSFQTMVPKLHSTNFKGMELIRPMYLIREKDIIKWANHNELKFINCACKFTENYYTKPDIVGSKRYETKQLIASLLKNNPLVEQNIFMSAHNVNLDMIVGYKQDGIDHNFCDEYEKRKPKGKTDAENIR